MSTGLGKYVVRVVGPTGLERYLTARWTESDNEKNAHRFTSAKAASQFGELYFKIPRGLCYWDVQDIADPERGAVNWDDDE